MSAHITGDELARVAVDPAALEPDRRSHLEGCPECRGRLGALVGDLGRLAHQAQRWTPRPVRPLNLAARPREAKRWTFPRPSWSLAGGLAGGLAAAAVLLAVVLHPGGLGRRFLPSSATAIPAATEEARGNGGLAVLVLPPEEIEMTDFQRFLVADRHRPLAADREVFPLGEEESEGF